MLGSTAEQMTAARTNVPVEEGPSSSQTTLENSITHSQILVENQTSICQESSLMNGKKSSLPKPRDSPDSEPFDSRMNPTSSPLITASNENTDNHIPNQSKGKEFAAEKNPSPHIPRTAFDNTVIQILITSKIAKTKPLIIQNKISQPLKGARLAWCAYQGLPEESHSTIFLTWKGRRLFDVTSCRSLNFDAGSVITRDLPPFDAFFEKTDGSRIHMEAVTEEILAAGHESSPDMLGTGLTPLACTEESPEATKHSRSEITLKCPGNGELKMCVLLTTSISQVVGAYRQAKDIPAAVAVQLAFDGHRLNPESCLADYEITDGDLVDVLVKTALQCDQKAQAF